MSIEVRGISKTFGAFRALDNVDLCIEPGELVALLGPSGSGKTTLLRIIAGLEVPDTGTVLLEGEDATSRDVQERQVGFVFQHYALFRHMSVLENIAFGLRVRPRKVRLPDAAIRAKVHELLSLVQLEGLADRYPSQLSGGQRQRVALARALAIEPRVLLLDEPFGALDARVRQELRRWLRRLHNDLHVTGVLVTHDQEEALEVADRVVVMNGGRIEQIGTPAEIYDQPANPFVFNFLGNVNLFHGRVNEGRVRIGPVEMDMEEHLHLRDTPVVGYARPHEVELTAVGAGDFEAVVRHIRPIGPVIRIELQRQPGGEALEVELTRERYYELGLVIGDHVGVTPRSLRVFVQYPGHYQI